MAKNVLQTEYAVRCVADCVTLSHQSLHCKNNLGQARLVVFLSRLELDLWSILFICIYMYIYLPEYVCILSINVVFYQRLSSSRFPLKISLYFAYIHHCIFTNLAVPKPPTLQYYYLPCGTLRYLVHLAVFSTTPCYV